MEHRQISSEPMGEKKILKLNIILMMKKSQEFRVLSSGKTDFHRLARPRKCECRFETRCSLLVSVCVAYTCLRGRNNGLNFVLVGETAVEPYIESATALSDTLTYFYDI